MTPFEAFIALQDQLRRDRPDALPLGETRIARALAAIRPTLAPPTGERIYRCDLARAWCAQRGMPAAWSARALVCEGVRHALSLLLPQLDAPVGLPLDVYPVYARLAAQAGVATHGFPTFPDFDLARIFASSASGARHIVLPCPLKLHGRAWTDDEFAAAARWLAGDPARRLVLDGVYAFGQPLAPGVLALIETDQVIYLDSMSKGWLHEQVFGAAVVPARDFDRLSPIFHAAPPSQDKLATAAGLLATDTPARLDAALGALRTRTLATLAARGLVAPAPPRGYLIPLPCAAARALADHNVVAIPLAVFGGAADAEWSFASALSLAT
jgi:aspartate/methionine/tyrosine aminotransferase